MDCLCNQCQERIEELSDDAVLRFVDQLEKDLFGEDSEAEDESLEDNDNSFGLARSSSNLNMLTSTPHTSPSMGRLTRNLPTLTTSTQPTIPTQLVPLPTSSASVSMPPCTDTI